MQERLVAVNFGHGIGLSGSIPSPDGDSEGGSGCGRASRRPMLLLGLNFQERLLVSILSVQAEEHLHPKENDYTSPFTDDERVNVA